MRRNASEPERTTNVTIVTTRLTCTTPPTLARPVVPPTVGVAITAISKTATAVGLVEVKGSTIPLRFF
jgi:hypothetical protein